MDRKSVPIGRLRGILEILALHCVGGPDPRETLVGLHAANEPNHRLDRAGKSKSELSQAQCLGAQGVPEGEAAGVHAGQVGLGGALRFSGHRRAGDAVSQGPRRTILCRRAYILSYQSSEASCREGGSGRCPCDCALSDCLVFWLFMVS